MTHNLCWKIYISVRIKIQLQELNLTGWVKDAYTREITCEDPIEKLHYFSYVSILQYDYVFTDQLRSMDSVPRDMQVPSMP